MKTISLLAILILTTLAMAQECQTGKYPDYQCTPGAVLKVTQKEVCKKGYAKSVRDVKYATKKEVLKKYGIKNYGKGRYEIDHLISLELGGSNDISNLWPERAEPRPGFHEKDKVENYLHKEVCEGRMTLKEAQELIAHNWTDVYQKINNGP